MTALAIRPTSSLDQVSRSRLANAIATLRTLFEIDERIAFIVAYRTSGAPDHADGCEPDECRLEYWKSDLSRLELDPPLSPSIICATDDVGLSSLYLDTDIAIDDTSSVLIPRTGICWFFASEYRLRTPVVPASASPWVCRHPLAEVMRPIIDGDDTGHDVLEAMTQLQRYLPEHAAAVTDQD